MDRIKDVLVNPRHAKWLGPVLVALDAVLCGLIILKVPYTEIDWRAYMEQIQMYIDGERDYTFIKGSTGPLVYPGLHVYIYRILYALTGNGEDIKTAQIVFAGVYLISLYLVFRCYALAQAPPYLFPMLVMSKRLHSIFLLRCFNDCFAVGFLFAAIYFYQRRKWTVGSLFFTVALGVKMSILLTLPAVATILLLAMGRERFTTQVLLIAQMQVLFGYQFVSADFLAYVSRAFDIRRQFLYEWTVNWRFVPEETFLSKPFAIGLLVLQVSILTGFGITRWIKPSGRSLVETAKVCYKEPSGPSDQREIYRRVTPTYIFTSIMTANAIGMLCARSLHYQFYSWIAWGTPFLLWRAGFHPIVQYALWAAQEWAWNVFPSTPASSMTVVGILSVVVAGVWWGTRDDFQSAAPATPTHHDHVSHEHVE